MPWRHGHYQVISSQSIENVAHRNPDLCSMKKDGNYLSSQHREIVDNGYTFLRFPKLFQHINTLRPSDAYMHMISKEDHPRFRSECQNHSYFTYLVQMSNFIAPHKSCLIEGGWSCIDLARNRNSGCANEILGCAKFHFWWKSPWKWKNLGDFRVCN